MIRSEGDDNKASATIITTEPRKLDHSVEAIKGKTVIPERLSTCQHVVSGGVASPILRDQS